MEAQESLDPRAMVAIGLRNGAKPRTARDPGMGGQRAGTAVTAQICGVEDRLEPCDQGNTR